MDLNITYTFNQNEVIDIIKQHIRNSGTAGKDVELKLDSISILDKRKYEWENKYGIKEIKIKVVQKDDKEH